MAFHVIDLSTIASALATPFLDEAKGSTDITGETWVDPIPYLVSTCVDESV